MIRVIQHRRSHAHIFAVHLFTQAREGIYFRNRRQQNDAVQPLSHQKAAHIVKHVRRTPVHWTDNKFEVRVTQRLQYALLHVEYHLRIRVVVDKANQEIAAQRERTRLWIGDISGLPNNCLNLFPRVIMQGARAVYDTADGLF